MGKPAQYRLTPDRPGLIWDLLLYVPTVGALGLIAIKLWYGSNETWGYAFMFLASFFFFVGANRIIGGRLMLLPSSPVVLDVDKRRIRIELRNGDGVELVKDLRFYPDYAGKSFGLAGLDLSGQRRQFVLYRGQFSGDAEFQDARSLLAVYK